ncbi:MAG TPA: ABC transporter ATP-binding protein [Candidatus Saccharimonadales bacterium]
MKLSDDVAIRVHDVHKDFHLPHHKEDSIKHRVITTFQKKDKGIDTLHALRGITFDIKKGEFFGIVGRNGSGKSTLLKIIAEIYTPTKGHITRRGRLVPFIELGVGFNPDLTGRENVYLNGALLGFTRKEIDAMYDEIVEFAELGEFMDQRLKNYSSGMQVRLAFSVAIRADGDILLLDEVLAVGDAAFQRKCYDYFNSLKERKKTIIFVTHGMGAVREYCDKAILIENGKIVQEGNAEDVSNAYTRMFNPSKDPKHKQTNERWGSGEAQFTDITAHVTDEKVTVDVVCKGKQADLRNVIVGMDIYDDKQRLVSGIDDEEQKKHQFDVAKGETKHLRYVFDNLFGGGDYKFTISLKSRSGGYVYDFWRDATSFSNTKDVGRYFPVLLPVEIKEK